MPIVKLDEYIEGKPQKISQYIAEPVKFVPECKIDEAKLEILKCPVPVYAMGMKKALQILGLDGD